MTSKRPGTGKRANSAKGRRAPVISPQKQIPWLAISAVAMVVILAGVIGFAVLNKASDQRDRNRWAPTASNQHPAKEIKDVISQVDKYVSAVHVGAGDRVAYDIYPPVGGPHDGYWAACNGVVYSHPVRDENMVHTLEHGAVWIAYDPERIKGDDLIVLEKLVSGKQFMVLSPYPALEDHPISLQAWGHRLQVDTVEDERIEQFITALRRNPYVYPEIGATCDQPSFPIEDPPAFDPSPPGDDAIPLDGGGLEPETGVDHSAPDDAGENNDGS